MDLAAVGIALLILLTALVLFQGALLLGLVRSVALLQQAMSSGAEPADAHAKEPAPSFSAVDLEGRTVGTAERRGRTWALLFVSPDCRSCTTTVAEMAALREKAAGQVLVVCRASEAECRILQKTYAIESPVVVDDDRRISALYRVTTVPTAVLIDAAGFVQSRGAPLRDELEQVLQGHDQVESEAEGAVAS